MAAESLLYSRLAEAMLLRPVFRLGYWRFQRTGVTPAPSYSSFRKLHCITQGAINRELSAEIARRSPPIAWSRRSAGVLGEGDELSATLDTAVSALRRDGIFVFPHRLDARLRDPLLELARRTPARLVPAPTGAPPRAVFDPAAPRAPRYQLGEPDLLDVPAAQQLIADASLIELARRYLETDPINDLITMWWSAPSSAPSSEAAQLFHFDMDRIRFLKIFVYLTDVGPDQGPHVYVRGSHAHKPPQFFRDRRFSDEEVQSAFRAEDILEIVGPAGTIIAADTSGLHKGKPLVRGSRLMFQVELTNSLFGQAYERHRVRGALADAVRSYPGVLRRFEAT